MKTETTPAKSFPAPRSDKAASGHATQRLSVIMLPTPRSSFRVKLRLLRKG